MGSFNVWQKDQIPFQEQANKLFGLSAIRQNKTEEQQIIPFLGAGVSISNRHWPETPEPQLPNLDLVDKLAQELGLSEKVATTFFRIAAFLALRLESAAKANLDVNDDTLFEYLISEKYPPSGSELARLFANRSPYSSFSQIASNVKGTLPKGLIDATDADLVQMLKLLANITRIANPPDALTSIASYFENKNGRDSLWENLRQVISEKKEVTTTHRLLAAAAKKYLDRPDDWQEDYLILTTNYDCLMEDALDEVNVPYIVLTTRRSDRKVTVRFSENVSDPEGIARKTSGLEYPNLFKLKKPKQAMVLMFKLHGCLYSKLGDQDDGLVISDNDYVEYISQMSSKDGRIPPDVNNLMQDKPFLFLGYSLSDWNVRSVFQSLRKKRGEDFRGQDYSVMFHSGDYERLFFQKNEVAIIETDLNAYCTGIIDALKKLAATAPDQWDKFVTEIVEIVKA